jgi:YbbR domain-containing protein
MDLSNINDIATVKSTLQARDVNGKTVTEGIQIVPATINVNVVLQKKQLSKKVNIKPQFTGNLADGFSMGEVTTDPPQVSILGDQTQVDALNEIDTMPIDITGKSEDFTQAIDLVQPDGIVAAPTMVTIQVKITKTAVNGVKP